MASLTQHPDGTATYRNGDYIVRFDKNGFAVTKNSGEIVLKFTPEQEEN